MFGSSSFTASSADAKGVRKKLAILTAGNSGLFRGQASG
jgi:hypothetical protein